MSKKRVLILCTGNSARSQMAEGLLRAMAGDQFEVFSAGTRPVELNPNAVTALREAGVDSSTHRSKSVDEFAGQQQGPGEEGANLFEVMQHRDNRPLLRVPTANDFQEVIRGPPINGGEWLIQNNDVAVLQQQADEQNPLKLPRREIADGAVFKSFQTHQSQSFPGFLP